MQIKFVVTDSLNELTWDEWNSLEQGVSKEAKSILARYLVDDDDKPIPHAEALKILGSVKLKDLADVTGKFWKALRENAVNPPTGG